MSQKQFVYDKLQEMNIPYQSVEHSPVYTVEEMEELDFPTGSDIAKNLFLRNAKGNQHYLLIVRGNQRIDLKEVKQIIGSTRLSFASEERLQEHLQLTKGAVSPLGLLNDDNNTVSVYIDKALENSELIGIHPNDNTATLFITFSDLTRFIQNTGHEVHEITFQ